MKLLNSLVFLVGCSAFVSATASSSSSALPTLPTSVSKIPAVSSLLATATPSPNLGDPANILSYPICAQTCSNQSTPIVTCNVEDLACVCGPEFRQLTSACEQITCNDTDSATVSILANELCGPLYSATPTLGAAVSAAIASGTSVAAAEATKDVTDINNYPTCGQKCINAALPPSGCGSLANRTCICKGPYFSNSTGTCELASCKLADLELLADLANELCEPVGGFVNGNNATVSTTTGPPTPTVSEFAGGVERVGVRWGLLGLMGAGVWVMSVL